MGATKTDAFTTDQLTIATMAKALGHPARIAIVEYLLSVQTCICGDIVNHLPLAQPTVSQHLRELKNADIIKGIIEGNAICYCINPKAMELIGAYFLKIAASSLLLNQKCC